MKRQELFLVLSFFLLLTVVFFHKIFWGLLPIPADLIVGGYYPWLDYKWGNTVGVAVKNPILSDAVSIMYPLKSLAAEIIRKGDLPLWNPYMFGGYPLLASLQLGLLFPTMLFYVFFSIPTAWTIQIMFQPFLGAIFSYFFLRSLKLSILSSIFGSIIYGFGGYSLIWLEWNTHVATASFLPLLFYLTEKVMQTKKIYWGTLLSLAICFQIFAGYIQIIPICFLLILLWAMITVQQNRLKNALQLILFIALGVSLSAIFLFPSFELLLHSQRSVEIANPGETFFGLQFLITVLIPDFFGNPSTANFWGNGNYLSVAIYSGIASFIFSIISLISLKKHRNKTIIFFASVLFSLIFLISNNVVSNLLYSLGIFGGSSVSLTRFLFISNFCLAVLASFGLEQLLNGKTKINIKSSVYTLLFLTFVCGFIFITIYFLKMQTEIYPDPSFLKELSPTIINYTISLRNSILPLLFLSSIVVLLTFIQLLPKFKMKIVIFFIFPILIFDLFRFGLKYNSFSPIKYLYPPTTITDFLKQNIETFRFAAEKEILSANMWVPYSLSSYPGYDGVYPYTSAKLLAVINSGNPNAVPQKKWGVLDNTTSSLLSSTSTKYILALKRNNLGEVKDNGEIGYQYKTATHLTKVFEDKSVAILENKQVLPRAYFVYNVHKGSDEIQTLKNMLSSQTQSVAYSPTLELHSQVPTIPPKVIYTSETNSKVKIETDSQSSGFLVVNDTYYPGWEATVDKKPTTIHQASYAFRGVEVPTGKHTVEFTYQPKSLLFGTIISFGTVVILIGLTTIRKRFTL